MFSCVVFEQLNLLIVKITAEQKKKNKKAFKSFKSCR